MRIPTTALSLARLYFYSAYGAALMTDTHRKTNHQMIEEALKVYQGKVLHTSEMRRIVLSLFPEFKHGSFLPNDHSDVGNKHPCSCSGTSRRLFDRVARHTYKVL